MISLERSLNLAVPAIITLVILGAFGIQLFLGETPCPLCLLQRVGMIGAATSCLLNIRFGVHVSHYGAALLAALFGGFVALRQISLHACPGFPTFGEPVFGLNLYTWSFIIHACIILVVACLLFLFHPQKHEERIPMTPLEKWVAALFFTVVAANILLTYLQCGLGPCSE